MLRYAFMLFALFAVAVALPATLLAQPTDQTQHWDFDGSDQEFAAVIKNVDQPNVADGIKDFGVYLDGQGVHFEPSPLAANADFTCSFWVNFTTVFTPRTIFLHEAGSTTFQAQVAQGQLSITLNGQPLAIAEKTLQPGTWYHWAYVRSGTQISYFLEGERVYADTWAGKGAQRIAIGAGHGTTRSLEGILDEVTLAQKARTQVELVEAMNALRPAPPVEEPSEPAPPVSLVSEPDESIVTDVPPTPQRENEPKAAPKAAPLKLNPKWKDKRNQLALEVPVMSNTVALRYWNDETYYDETISLQLNNGASEHIGLLVPRSARRAGELTLDLKPDALNYITVAAEDMSIYDQQNKLKFQLVVDGVAFEDVYEVAMTRYQNAVIAINHVPLNPDKKTIVPIASTGKTLYKVVVENTILDPVVLPTQSFTVTLTNKSGFARELALSLNASKVIKTLKLEAGETQTLNLTMRTPDQDVLILEAMYLRDGERFPFTAEVANDEGVTLATINSDLSAVNNLLPVAYVPPAVAKRADNEKYIIVDTEDIVLQVRDFSKVDGDVVTIKQNGETILADYTLTADYRDVPVKLAKDELNRLTFIPVSMGRSRGENTAYVMVRANGKVIHEFSLRSLDVNKPARIFIQYAGE